jgi:hypothetical protein
MSPLEFWLAVSTMLVSLDYPIARLEMLPKNETTHQIL